MEILIDANIVVGFYKETVLGIENDLTGDVEPLFRRLGSQDTCFVDENGMIESEWQKCLEKEWFTGWYPQLLAAGKLEVIPTTVSDSLESKIRTAGFPKSSRDIWYVRVASTLLSRAAASVYLISEDLDFYDPTKKKTYKGDKRTEFIKKGQGPVEKILRKHSINVRAACRYP